MASNTFTAFPTLRPGVARVEAQLQDFAFPAHSHDHVCIGLVRSGEHDCRYGQKRHTVEVGDLMLVNPGQVHDGRPSGRHGRRYSMLEIDPASFRAISEDVVGRENLEFQRAVVRDPRARRALAAWLGCLDEADIEAEREACALLFGRLASPEQPTKCRTEGGLAAQLRQRMREGGPTQDGIGTLAAELGASRYQLIRAFKSSYGLTPEDFRRQLRVERARSALASPSSLAEVATAAGFADQSHMTREFRRLVGLTPAAYRRALRDEF